MTTSRRILLTLPVRNGLENWEETSRRLLDAIPSSGYAYDLRDLPEALTEKISGDYESTLVSVAHVKLAQEAAADGYDAIAMGCMFEPGVAAAKEVIDIPVVGALEACVYMALVVADRFSIVKGGAGSIAAYQARIRQMGLESRLASIRTIESTPLDFAAEETSLPERMLEVARRAVESDGAGAIISYGGISVLTHLRSHLSVPVLNPVQCQVLMAEALHRALTHR